MRYRLYYIRLLQLTFLSLSLVVCPAAFAQYSGEKAGNYNSDYERSRREAARQLEAQNARNRQPNTPAVKSTYGNPQRAATTNNAPQ